MFHLDFRKRSLGEVLEDRTGASVAEGLAGLALIMVVLGALAMNVTTTMGAMTTIATKAERQEYLAALVGDKHTMTTWGTPDAPKTQIVTMPNGHEVEITTWREDSGESARLTAVSPITHGEGAADCTGPSDVAKAGCIYASRLHADGIDGITPHAIVRWDPSMAKTGSDPVGTIDERVGTDTVIPQGVVFASGTDSEVPVWRYLVEAKTTDENGEIRISQAGKTLALFPVNTDNGNFFGTFTAKLGVPVTAEVTSGNVVVEGIFIYRAGETE